MYHANLRSWLCVLYSYKNNSRIWKINQGKNETKYCIYCEQEMLPSSNHCFSSNYTHLKHNRKRTSYSFYSIFFQNFYRIILWLLTNIDVTPQIKNELLTSIFTVIRQMRNVTKWRSKLESSIPPLLGAGTYNKKGSDFILKTVNNNSFESVRNISKEGPFGLAFSL